MRIVARAYQPVAAGHWPAAEKGAPAWPGLGLATRRTRIGTDREALGEPRKRTGEPPAVPTELRRFSVGLGLALAAFQGAQICIGASLPKAVPARRACPGRVDRRVFSAPIACGGAGPGL